MENFKKFLIFISILILIILAIFFGLIQKGEGEKFELGSPIYEAPFLSKIICRLGLKPIADSWGVDSNGQCSWPMCYCYICTKCGDGKCGLGENKCNCPEDCQ